MQNSRHSHIFYIHFEVHGRACLAVPLRSQSLTTYCGASVSNLSDFMWDSGGQCGSVSGCLLLITSHHCSVSIYHHPLRHVAPLTRHVTSSVFKSDISSLTWNLAAYRVVRLRFLIHVWPNFPLTLFFSGTWKVLHPHVICGTDVSVTTLKAWNLHRMNLCFHLEGDHLNGETQNVLKDSVLYNCVEEQLKYVTIYGNCHKG
jgi:hypothetical protein